VADSKNHEKILEHQLTTIAYQWLKLHPELESVTFRLDRRDKKSLHTEKKPRKGG